MASGDAEKEMTEALAPLQASVKEQVSAEIQDAI